MGPKYKVTGCARFFLFLVIFVPAVFFGAAYIRGENGMEVIRDFFSKITRTATEVPGDEASDETYVPEDLTKEIADLKKEIDSLREQIREKDAEIEKLKNTGQ